MPELPEVEIVCRNLEKLLARRPRLLSVTTRRKDLRFPFPVVEFQKLKGQRILKVRRRGKFLLLDFETHVLLSHLGMTGAWRSGQPLQVKRHCHLELELETGIHLQYQDPRRFGFVDVFKKEEEFENKFLKNVGPDALDRTLSAEDLWQKFRKIKAPIKNALMNQKLLAGVGNIYACEALFRAHISPRKIAQRLSYKQTSFLLDSLQEILLQSIDRGGSSISDYVDVEGKQGSFQNSFAVYDRAHRECLKCSTMIRHFISAGRSTYYCPHCQK